MPHHHPQYLSARITPDYRAVYEAMDETIGLIVRKDWGNLDTRFDPAGVIWTVKVPSWPDTTNDFASTARPPNTLATYLEQQLEHFARIYTRVTPHVDMGDGEAKWTGVLEITLVENADRPFPFHDMYWRVHARLVRAGDWKVNGLSIEDCTMEERRKRYPDEY